LQMRVIDVARRVGQVNVQTNRLRAKTGYANETEQKRGAGNQLSMGSEHSFLLKETEFEKLSEGI
jgi:hypothetical protein